MSLATAGIPAPLEGELGLAAAETGIRALQDNAGRLAKDARLMFTARRYASAAMLAAMAIEELARIPALVDLAGRRSPEAIAEGWAAFRAQSHDYPWSLFQGADATCSADEINGMLGFVRGLGSRIECLGAGAWAEPMRLIGRDFARELVGLAELLCGQTIGRPVAEIWLKVTRALPEGSPDRLRLDRLRGALASAGLGAQAEAVGALDERLSAGS